MTTPAASPEARLIEKYERDAFDSSALAQGLKGRLSVVGALLRAPGAILRDLNQERNLPQYTVSLILATLLFSAGYGAILGMFQPGLQTLYAAAKLPLVVLGTAFLCTPTFYVFNGMLGSKFTFAQTFAAVLFLAAATALVLVAFAPIAWFFTVSTQGPGFLTALHLFVFLVAVGYGMRSLNSARKYLRFIDATHTPINGAFLVLWFALVLFVALQMAYYYRPLIEPGPFHTGERGLFFEALRP